jgi:5-methylcytosine-specific restriction endonuclease McrA
LRFPAANSETGQNAVSWGLPQFSKSETIWAFTTRKREQTANTRRKASWARLIRKVFEIDPLKCSNCGATMRIIALIDDTDVVERILRHLKAWDPPPDTLTPAGPDPPLPASETLPLTYHPVPDIA